MTNIRYTQRFSGRSLYRVPSTDMAPWFPHGNSPCLVRECVWESGQNLVRWVFHGSPAGGAGLQLLWTTHVGVVCHLEDEFHEEHFRAAVIQTAVEDLMSGGS